MLPDETADSCEVVSVQVEIWGLIPSPACQQLLGAEEEQVLQSSCTVSVASPEWQPPSSSCLWSKMHFGFVFSSAFCLDFCTEKPFCARTCVVLKPNAKYSSKIAVKSYMLAALCVACVSCHMI